MAQRTPGGHSSRERQRSIRGLLISFVIAPICLSAFLSIAILLFGEFGTTEAKILLSALSLAGYSLAGLLLARRLDHDPGWLGPLGMSLSALGFLLTIILIWGEVDEAFLYRLTFSVLVVVVALTHAAILLPRSEEVSAGSTTLILTFIANAILSTILVIVILFDASPGESFFRIFGALAVLATLGTIVVPILRRLESSQSSSSVTSVQPPGGHYAPSGDLRFVYKERTVVLRVVPSESTISNFDVLAWNVLGARSGPVRIAETSDALDDRHTALAHAVQTITRSIDNGSFAA